MEVRNKKGQFSKGNTAGGRPKGSKNIATAEIRERFSQLIENNLEQLDEDLKALEPKDRIKAITDIAKFVLPSLKAIDFEVSGELKTAPITGMVIK